MILLAKNQQGYKNLCKIVSIGFLEGFYYKPRIDKEVLRQYSEGLICMSACIAGEIPELLLAGDYEGARDLAAEYKDIFGENFYIELQNHGLEQELRINPQLIQIAGNWISSPSLPMTCIMLMPLMLICMISCYVFRREKSVVMKTGCVSLMTSSILKPRRR